MYSIRWTIIIIYNIHIHTHGQIHQPVQSSVFLSVSQFAIVVQYSMYTFAKVIYVSYIFYLARSRFQWMKQRPRAEKRKKKKLAYANQYLTLKAKKKLQIFQETEKPGKRNTRSERRKKREVIVVLSIRHDLPLPLQHTMIFRIHK